MAEDGGEALAAGPLAAWLSGLTEALAGRADSTVPCGTCTACCTSAQFVHIGPDETATLARIPRALQFPAPGLGRGHVVIGYDERGHCPMLVNGACSIYEQRPRTCRTYDCRVFAATGVAADEDDPAKVAIARQASRWRFEHPGPADRAAQDAVTAAVVQLRRERRPGRSTGLGLALAALAAAEGRGAG